MGSKHLFFLTISKALKVSRAASRTEPSTEGSTTSSLCFLASGLTIASAAEPAEWRDVSTSENWVWE